jgi:hypothetical protein
MCIFDFVSWIVLVIASSNIIQGNDDWQGLRDGQHISKQPIALGSIKLITPEQLDWTIVALSIEEAAKLYLMTEGLTFAYSSCRQTASTSVIPVLETRD